MDKKKKVKAKNEIHNTLGITKEEIQAVIKQTVELEIHKYIHNTFDSNRLDLIIMNTVIKKINEKEFGSDRPWSGYKSFEHYVEDKVKWYLKSFVEKNYKIKIIKKKNAKRDNEYPQSLA